MQKHLRLVSVLAGVGGIGLLFLSGMLHLELVTILGWVLIAAGLVGSFVGLAIDDSPRNRSETSGQEEVPPASLDRSQLSTDFYSPGRK